MCCMACIGAEESSSGCQCNAMKEQIASRQDRDYDYIQVTWGIKIAKFLEEIELFPPKQSRRKKMFGSQLIGPQGKYTCMHHVLYLNKILCFF